MFTFFSIVFGLIWAVASFLLLFKVWDGLGPIVLGISKSHFVLVQDLRVIFLRLPHHAPFPAAFLQTAPIIPFE